MRVLDLLIRVLFGLLFAALVYFVLAAVVFLAIVISRVAYLPNAWVGIVVLTSIGFGIGAAKVEISFPWKNRGAAARDPGPSSMTGGVQSEK